MALAVVTVASGGLPVVDVTATFPRLGMPVTEAASGRGVPVTKVTTVPGLPVIYVVPAVGGLP
jgi:hypothetical protein